MKTILVIDDSLMLRMTFSKALREVGYNVIEAESGVEGLALARKHLPDLILSDVQMPGGDGTTLLREIRKDPVLRSRQVVLMTGKPELMTPRKGMEEGADDFLPKPVTFDVLLKCVATRLQRASTNWRVEDEVLAQLRSLVPAQLPHELFTPLAGIIGLVEILMSGSSPFSAEELADIYKDIYQSALRLHRTQRNYLLLLDLKNADPEVLMGSLSPDQVEQSIESGVRETLRLNPRKDDLTVRMSPCSLAIKSTDLSRLVEELLDNAFTYSRPSTPVVLQLSSDGQLTITDEGRGMTEEEIEQIGAFRQFDRDKRSQHGLGLGLVLVQRLINVYRGEFQMDSDFGRGTTVRVTLPVEQGGEAQMLATSPASASAQGELL